MSTLAHNGCCESSPETRSPYFRPMLANRYTSFARGFAQPKLDGVRCIARASGLLTRTGKRIAGAPHIIEGLRPFFETHPRAILDGELYNHSLRADFGAIVRLVRRCEPDPSSSEALLEYHVYDMPSLAGSFSARHDELTARLRQSSGICLVETRKVAHEEDYDALHTRWLGEGYEGSMWRANAPYQCGRSNALLKRKCSQDLEFRCLAVEPGTGAFVDKAKRVLCALPDGRTFRANVQASHKRALELLEEQHDFVTVKFWNYTASGIPRFPVAVKFWGQAREF
jgi:DNA ligase-1